MEGSELPLRVSGCPALSLLLTWGQHLYDFFLVPFYPLGVPLFSSPIKWGLFPPLVMYSEKGLAALVSERLRNDITELTFVFSLHHVPSCLALKGTWKTLKKKKKLTPQHLHH